MGHHYATDRPPHPNTIVVPGTGLVTVEPDVASIRLGVNLVRQTASAAREAAAATMSAILDALTAAGVQQRDRRTALVSLNPVTDYSSEHGPRITGYQVSNAVAVTVRDLAATGAVIDAALGAGASSLEGLEFRRDDPTAAEEQARTAAVADARRRAATIAAASGVTLGDVVAVSEVDRSPGPIPFGGAMRAVAFRAEAAETPVESGTQEIEVSVVVAFAIESPGG